MEIIKPGTYIDFMRLSRPVITATLVLTLLGVGSLFFPGPNYGIDFAGGTEIQVAFGGAVDTAELRGLLEELGHQGADVVRVEEKDHEFMIRVREVSAVPDDQQGRIRDAITGALGDDVVRDVRFSPGGDKITLRLARDVDQSALRAAVEGHGANVRSIEPLVGSEDVRLEVFLVGIADELVASLRERLGERGPADPERVEWVGPKAGKQLRDAAAKSLIYVIAFIMVYVALRFDLRFAPGGVVAMFHDAIITLGIYVLVQKEVNLTTVAAVLTVLGYSINDTIVVYDRIRENMGRYKDKSLREIINLSTSQTLSRTVITSGTTLLSILAFFIWGTPVIKDISFALFVGIIIGTYSSIYVASPITEWMDRRFFSKPARARA
ncbi:MAG: protein translocase subunit SecF [Myxococcales bacterium]|nr:protein translocase subunit SecF [Myxococcales bacterium]